jgi:hypothetical protein
MRHWKPFFYEYSKVPIWLSKFTPIEIKAITLFCFVFSRGEIAERTKRHETIHFQQFLETLVIGFIVIYYTDYLYRLVKYRDGKKAYRMICFEQEAHDNDDFEDYLERRKRYAWLGRK